MPWSAASWQATPSKRLPRTTTSRWRRSERWSQRGSILAATLLLILSPILTTAQQPSAPRTVRDDAWAVVPTVRPSVDVGRRDLRDADGAGDATRPMEPVRTVPSRPVVPVPTPRLIVVTVDPVRSPNGTPATGLHTRASGTASWYCGHGSACTRGYPGGLFAAAGPALRTGDWRGRVVVVSAGGRSVAVRLVDWCQCHKGTARERVLDLYSDVWDRLGVPLSRGLVKVVVTW